MSSPVHKITHDQIEHVLMCLRFIDKARKDLEAKGPGNEPIIDELKKSTDGAFRVLKDLPLVDK